MRWHNFEGITPDNLFTGASWKEILCLGKRQYFSFPSSFHFQSFHLFIEVRISRYCIRSFWCLYWEKKPRLCMSGSFQLQAATIANPRKKMYATNILNTWEYVVLCSHDDLAHACPCFYHCLTCFCGETAFQLPIKPSLSARPKTCRLFQIEDRRDGMVGISLCYGMVRLQELYPCALICFVFSGKYLLSRYCWRTFS